MCFLGLIWECETSLVAQQTEQLVTIDMDTMVTIRGRGVRCLVVTETVFYWQRQRSNHKEDGMKSQTTLHVMLKRLNLILEATGSH